MNLDLKKKLDWYVGGGLIVLLKPWVMLAGLLLRRNHDLKVGKDIVFIKMLGGGSLVIALPALLGLRLAYPAAKFKLVTTRSVIPFAEALGIFDEHILIDDRSVLSLLLSGPRALLKLVGSDTVIDLEVYSFLSVVLSLFTLARNRIGFYLENTFWRKNLFTHLIFFNRFAGTFYFYEEIAMRLGAQVATHAECKAHLITINKIVPPPEGSGFKVAVGHGCSGMGSERMLNKEQWLKVLQTEAPQATQITFLGVQGESVLADQIITGLPKSGISVRNQCGKLSFAESLREIAACDLFIGIDSGLLHLARALGKSCVTYFGPTDPATRLKPDAGIKEKIFYGKIPCSPCIHVAETPPCKGNNVCIQNLFSAKRRVHHSFMVE